MTWQSLPFAADAEAAFVALFADALEAFWLDSAGLGRWSYLGRGGEAHPLTDPPPCPFKGGRIGWFGYEAGSGSGRTAATPETYFMAAADWLAIDHHEGRTYVVSADAAWREETARALFGLTASEPQPGARPGPLRARLDRPRPHYLADVRQCLEWINDGETYQVCLTAEMSGPAAFDPLTLHLLMRRTNPAPFAAYLRWPGGAVVSASPERFLSVSADGLVEAKPIKGTAPRASDPALLLASEKDRAENLMIVDLLRNDLSKVCQPGTVKVPVLFGIESFATVHQMVSTVQGQLAPGFTGLDAVRAAFPGGSMTGAPKERTLGFIDRLEGRARGIYSGALGWLGDDGALDLSIVIRTVVVTGGRFYIGVGGGVVAQSTPEGEFAEMLLKAEAPLRAVALAATGRPDFIVEGAQG